VKVAVLLVLAKSQRSLSNSELHSSKRKGPSWPRVISV